VRLLARPLAGGRVGVVGTALADRDEALASLRRELLVAAPLALLAAAALAYAFAAGALRPVERMRRRAAAISAEPGEERLPVSPAHDELRSLAVTLNAMIDRLRQAALKERRFAADASHELRTPLALLRTEVDLALDGERPRAELVEALRSASEQTERLTRLTEDLLLLARADDDRLALSLEPVAADELLARMQRRFAPAAARAGRRLETSCPPDLRLVADAAALERALVNLVANALQHGAGTITLSASASAPQLRVCDEGHGEACAELLQRFRRGPASAAGGSGLGLALVAAIARAHGGSAGVASDADGFGAWISLPRSAREAADARATPLAASPRR
jgi:signal transduction histidine kinase